mgnify:CR=1 FL=1
MTSENRAPNEDKKRAINFIYPIIYELAKNPEQYKRANRLYLKLQPEIINYIEHKGDIEKLCKSFFRVIEMSNRDEKIINKTSKLKKILEKHTPKC